MNHQYRSIWNELTQTFVAVAENVRQKGKSSRSEAAGVPEQATPLRAARGLMALEQRFMFDGAAATDAAHALPDSTAIAALPEIAAPVLVRAADPSLNQDKKEVVFVDTSVTGYKTLEASIRDGVEIVEISASQSGLAQIAQWAKTHEGYDSIQILSHGSSGTLNLGTDGINDALLANSTVKTELALLGHALKAGGDLMIYGCDIGQGSTGQQFVHDLALATGADVAASSDATGSAAKGGDWDLEVKQGDIQAEIPINSTALNTFSGLLTAYSGTLGFNTYVSTPGAGSGSDYTVNVGSYTFTADGHLSGFYTLGGDQNGGFGAGNSALVSYGGLEDRITLKFNRTSDNTIANFAPQYIWVLAQDITNTTVLTFNGTISTASLTAGAWTKIDLTSLGTVSALQITSNRSLQNNMFDDFKVSNVQIAATGPTVSDSKISISGASGTGGAYKIGDTVTATWNNSASGDNNTGITGVTMDFSQFGGGSAVTATNNGSGVWTATYTIVSGAIDATSRNVSVTATSSSGSTTTADTTNATVDSIAPTVTDARISISGGTGTGGAFKIGDTVTATWNNTAGGDNNSDTISAVSVDFSQFGGGSAVSATNSSGTWTATYTITAGAIDATNRNISVTATDNAGNTKTTADTTNATVDSVAPTVSDSRISISGGSGTGGAFKIGDTVTATWNNTASGDNNSDTISAVTMNFSQFGGGSAVAATNSSGTWTATYTIVAGAIDSSNRNVSVTATDNAGNTTTAADTTNATVDNVAPTVTDARISISGGTGTGGAFKIGDTVTATWNNTASGDNNSDTISGVTVDFSQFGGGSAVTATNSSGTWTATYTIVAGAIDGTNKNVSVTVTDNAGNTTTTADTTNATVDTVAPTVSDSRISISGATGTGGTFKIGDTVTATWNNTAGGDNNSDTISAVTMDFSQFGGGSAVTATNSSGTWTATYTIVAGAIDGSNRNISVTATDNAGNSTSTADTTNATVDNVAPVMTDAKISISGGSGTSGAYLVGDTVTATWNAANTGGDGNTDTLTSVTVDFSQFGGGSAVAATNTSGTWTASYTIVAGAINGTTNRNVSFTATDNAGNTTTTADTTNATVDNVAPSVTSVSVPANSTYGASANLDFTVNFGENVTVATGGGTPRIALTIGSTTRYASYVSGSGTSALLFRYTTQTGDNDSDGITVASAWDSNGGSIKDASGNDASTTLNSVASTTGILVSTNQAPVLSTPTAASYTDTSAADSFSNTSGVLSATDNENDTITYGITGGTTGGSTVIGSVTYDVSKAGSYGTLYVVSTGADIGKYVYVPNTSAIEGLSANTSETFTVTASDAYSSGTTTYTVNLTAANDTPTLTTPTAGSYTDTSANDSFTNDTGTLAGADRDSGQTLTYGISGGTVSGTISSKAGSYGTLSVDTSTGAYTYVPNASAINALTSNTTDTFTVTVSDGAGGSNTATYTVNLTAANDTPTLATPTAGSYTDTSANDSFTNNTGTLAGADRDSGQTLTYGISGGTVSGTTSSKAGSYGTLSVDTSTGAYTYVPNASAINALTSNTTDTFTVTVSDGAGGSNTATYTVNLTAANDTPTLTTPTAGSYTDTSANDSFTNDTGTLAGADRDSGQTLTYGISGGTVSGTTSSKTGSYGTLSVDTSTGAYTYVPNASAINALTSNTTDTFTVTVSDGAGGSTTATYTVNLTAANDTPTLATPTAGSYTDTSANDSFTNDTGTLAGADRDSGQTLTYGISGGTVSGTTSSKVGSYGTLSVDTSTGAYTYVPNASAINALTSNTTDTFTVTVSDGAGGSNTATYTVNLTAANDTPTLTTPTVGSYTDTSANDSFTNDTGTLAGADRDSGQTLTYGISGGTVSGTTSSKMGSYGTLSVDTSTGAYTYVPNASAINALTSNTTDTFTVTVSDGAGGSTTATYTVNLTAANDTPTLATPTAGSYTDTSANDSFTNDTGTLAGADRDSGQTLTYGISGGTVSGTTSSKAGSYGTLSVDTSTGAYTYVPNASAINALTSNTTDTFTVTVSDGAGGSNTATYTVNLTAANDTPTLATPTAGSYTDTSANDSFTNNTGTLAGADRDSGQTLTYGISGGTVSGTTSSKAGSYGTLSVDTSTGAYTYVPNASAINALTSNTTDTFTVTVNDGAGGSNTATYTVNLTAANDTPTLATPTAGSYTDTSANDSFTNNTGTLAGADRDSGQTLTYGISGGTVSGTTSSKTGSYGTLSVDTSTGAYTYVPNASAINALTSNTTDTFTVTVSDGAGGSNTATYTVNLTAANDTPTLATPTAGSYTDTSANDSFTNDTGTLAGADRDSGQTLTYGISGGTVSGTTSSKTGSYGTLSVDTSTGAYTYVPNTSAINALTSNTTDTFTVTVNDGAGGSNTATYTVNLTAANDTPTLATPTADSYTDTSANDSFTNDTGTLAGADRDSGQTLTYGISGGTVSGTTSSKTGSYGTLSVDTSTGAYTYVPNASAINALTSDTTDTFTVTVSDGAGGSNTATYTVNLTAANDTPTLATPTAGSYTDTSANDSFTNNTGTLAGADRDSGQTLTYGISGGSVSGTTSAKAGSYGTLSVDTNTGAYTYVPNASAINALTSNTTDTFTVTVSDGAGGSTTATYTVNLTAANDTPTLATPTAGSYTDTSANDSFTNNTGTLAGADRDSGQTLTYGISGGTVSGTTSSKAGSYGTLSVDTSTGAYTYVPNASAINALTSNTTDTFTVTVSDGAGGSTTATYTVNLTAANDTPTLATPTAGSYTDTSANDSFTNDTGTLAGADRDSGQTLTYGISGGTVSGTTSSKTGSYGTLSVDTSTGAYTYVPNASAINALTSNTTDTFTVTVSDGAGGSTTATYTVNLTAANDTPTLSTPAAGSYTDTSANDSFTNNTGTLAGADRDSGQTLTYGISGGSVSGTTSAKAGSYGTLSVDTSTGAYTYVPNASAINALTSNTTDTFTVTVSDGAGGSTTATYTVNLTAANDTPTLATPTAGSYTDTSANDSFTNDTGTLAGADRDSGQTLTYGISGGTVSGTASSKAGSYGTLSVDTSTGAYTYVPNASAINALTSNTTDTFTVTVSDGAGGSTTATYTVNLTAANDTPTLSTPTAGSYADTSANDSFTNDTGTLAGADRDSGQTLTYGISGGTVSGTTSSKTGSYGTLSVDTSTGAYTYVPNASAINALTSNTTDTFTVTVSDGAGGSTTATYTVNLTAANDTPTLATPTAGSYTDTSANDSFTNDTGTLAGADRDSGQTLTYGISGGTVSGTSSSKAGSYGTLSVDTSTGAYTYVPNASAINALTSNTTDTFTITVSDGAGGSNTATYTVNLTAANDTPTLTTPTAGSYTDTSANDSFTNDTGTLAGADRDSGQTLTYGISGGTVSGTTSSKTGSYGTLSVDTSTGAYTYVPNASAINALTSNTTDTFTVTVSDGAGGSNTATYTVNLTAANDTPTLTAGSSLSYTEGHTPVVLENALTLGDRDVASQVTGAQVVIQNVLAGDTLSFDTLGYDISGSYNSTTGTLTLTGTDTLAHYQAVLRTVGFSSSSTDPTNGGSNGVRTITWSVNDNGSPQQTGSAASQVTITAINNAPVLEGGSDLQDITEDATSNQGQTVASFATGISDPDGAHLAFGIAIEGIESGNGRWQYSRDNGQTWTDVGAVSGSNALLLLSTDRVRFVPDTTTGTRASLNYRAWDTSTGQAGNKVDTATTGNTSAFSTATQTAHLHVTDVNDAPTGSVTVTGLVQVGETLSASNTLADVDGMGSVSYAWYNSDGTLIGTGATLTIDGTQVGKGIHVVARYTDGQGNTEQVSSTTTSAVTVIPPRTETTSTTSSSAVSTPTPVPLTPATPTISSFSELPILQSPLQTGSVTLTLNQADAGLLRQDTSNQGTQLTRNGNTGSNFPILVSTDRDGLAVLRGLQDVTLNSARGASFAVPADAFSHSDPNALVSLNATQANGQPLPPWLRFDPVTGRFQASPPPGARGTVEIRVNARDNQGHVVSTTFKLKLDTISNRSTQHDGGPQDNRLAGRGGLSEQLQQALRPHQDAGQLSAFLKGLQAALHDPT